MFGFISNSTILAELLAIAKVQSSQSTQLLSVISASSSLTNELTAIAKAQLAESEQLDTIIQLCTPVPNLAVKIRLALPTRTRKGILMATYPLANDEIVTIPILTDDVNGDPVTPPSGDTFTAVCSIPASLNAVINGTNLVVNALVAAHVNPVAPAAPDLFVTVSDSAGLQTFVQAFDIVADVAPKSITLDLAHATVASQPVPTNPGP